MRLAKWDFVVIEMGLWAREVGVSERLFSEEGKRRFSGVEDAGRRICAALDMEARAMAGWGSVQDSPSLLFVEAEKFIESEEAVAVLFGAGEIGRAGGESE